ncbi:NAD(P)-binding domain-containing protein [Curtobacterium sp. SORGH_AS_0776]|uniref:NAD(P)-binding domain-containing protein n=1 Tax=Curtobacterium sp. SORGH_AS_0776 TaxID=3041798 RepID=UPI0028564D64|nr:NAD(P)-binding domain-containing protein [Curtobacterium sp. SORGH_AS_0776]MDR6170309.1 cation diffusion facilitator CzcD-associated flavoprotein CzcO [Curtobacterium sp. SORGH_AS_0776]
MTDDAQAPADQHARVVVIGAGQAGLSVGYHLRRLGLTPGSDLVLLDRAPSTGGAWQFRWEALRLGAAHRVHDLPGMNAMGLRFDDADRSRPARDVVGEYYRRFEQHYDLRVRRPVSVSSVSRIGDSPGASGGLCVTVRTADGRTSRIGAEVVVNASGTWGTPFVPWYPGRDAFGGRQLDTTEYRSAAEFAGQDVVVVGGGTSAIGFLLELDGVAERTRWFTRRPMVWSESAALDLESAVAAVDEQDRAARAGETLPSIVSGTGVPVSRRIRAGLERGVLQDSPMFTRLDETGVVTAEGEHVHADAVIWATGFRADLRHLAPLHLRTAAGGIVVEDGRSVDEPRLFLAGYGPQASTIGANRAGRRIARQVMDVLADDDAGSAPAVGSD